MQPMLQSAPPGARETRPVQWELCLHFFGQFFESEWVATPGQLKTLAGGAGAVLLSLAIPFAQAYFHKYRLLHDLDNPQAFQFALMADTLFLISGTMLVSGLATVLQWSALFPSRRDYFAFASLPVLPRQVFVGKILALAAFLACVVIAVAGPASGLPGLATGRYSHTLGWHAVGIFVACVAGGLFTSLSVITLQGVLLNVLPVALYESTTLAVQGGLLLLFCASAPGVIATANLSGSMGMRPEWIFAAPPFWFLGLSQMVAGSVDPAAAILGRRALISVAAISVATVGSYLWSYRRHRIRVLESTPSQPHGTPRVFSLGADWMVRDARTRAAFSFILKSLGRSAQHRLVLTMFVGMAFAVLSGSVAGALLTGVQGSTGAQVAVLTVPLVFSICTLTGFRFLFRLPCEIRANWILRMNAPGHGPALLLATERFLYLGVLVPLALLVLPVEVYILGWSTGMEATVLGMAPAPVLMEALFASFITIPFSSSYLPGRRMVSETLIHSGVAFLVYVTGLSLLIRFCLGSVGRAAVFLVVLFGMWWKLRRNRVEVQRETRLDFEERFEPEVQLLNLERD